MLIILIGNIGTGKTHYRNKHFTSNEITICPDEWTNLNNSEKNDLFITEIHNNLQKGLLVIIDGNNVTKKSRKKYIKFAELYNSKIIAIDFGKGNEITLKRRLSEKPLKEHTLWIESHNYYFYRYEKPTIEEGFYEVLEVINY